MVLPASLDSLLTPWNIRLVSGLLDKLRGRPSTPPQGGNRVELLLDGKNFFDALLAAIAQAQRYIFVETYILQDDTTGNRVADALIERAKAGLEVAVLYDDFGSLGLGTRLPNALREAGVKIHAFHAIRFLPSWRMLKRDHRKLLVADGRFGFVGGMNISDDYAAVEDGGAGWRDTAVSVEGPAVQQLEAMFREVWAQQRGEALRSQPSRASTLTDGCGVLFLQNAGHGERAEIRRAYLRAIVKARAHVRIMVAYFSPDRALIKALCRAARRGVQVEIITAGATDIRPVLQIARGLYGRLLRNGVKIYEWRERILHAKTAVVDDDWATVGSANLSHRMWLMDLEVNATFRDPEIVRQMNAQFESDQARCEEIDLQTWRQRSAVQRMLEWFFGLFRRLV